MKEAEIRAWLADEPECVYAGQRCNSSRCPKHSPERRAARHLLSEIDRLRALPVLRTCWDCAHNDGSGHWCAHPETRGRDLAGLVDGGDTVPAWCPLRGTR